MNQELNYSYLLAVHTVCIDGQLHQNELRFMRMLAENIGINKITEAAAELILAQDDKHLNLSSVLKGISPGSRENALALAALAAQFDGVLDSSEQNLLEELRSQWGISEEIFASMTAYSHNEAQRLIADTKTHAQSKLSTKAKVLGGLESVLGKKFLDHVVTNLASEKLKERIQDYRIEALLSGSKYDNAIADCREVGLRDIEFADACLHATASALQEICIELDAKIAQVTNQIGSKSAQAAREALRSMQEDREQIGRVVNQELLGFQELQIKKRRAMNFYTIAFMGRSKAGKSTLHAVVTGGGWDQIGVGRQNTTRLNRVYEWNNIRIIDTPGIATPGGEELEKIAESIIDEADLVCFVVTNNNQQTSEFEFLKHLRSKGKPLLVLLNVKEDLSNQVRLKRFIERPDQIFSDAKDRLGGHIDRIRRDAAHYYGASNFPIVPVQLLAAQIAQQQPEHEQAASLLKASRLQQFLDSVRISLLNEGLLRRSQNLLGSTVADIERPGSDLKARAEFYLNFSKQIQERSKESEHRLKKAQEDHSRQLAQDLQGIFAALQREVPDFAEYHWDDSESTLNEAWSDEISRFGLEDKINGAQEKAVAAFSLDMTDLLEEVGRELSLHRRLAIDSNELNEQDSSGWAKQSSKWGGGILGVAGSIAMLIPGGQLIGGVMLGISVVLGVLASFFESKASKRRKAVAKISSALESQIEKQEKKVVGAALGNFKEQCLGGAAAVQEYFQLSANGLSAVSQAIAHGVDKLQMECNTLNKHFAARILDFAGNSPSELSFQNALAQIHGVRRKVGEYIEIDVSLKFKSPKNLDAIESIIQEKITLKKVGA